MEFNKAALSLADAFPTDQKKAALNRLLKVGAGKGISLHCWPGIGAVAHWPAAQHGVAGLAARRWGGGVRLNADPLAWQRGGAASAERAGIRRQLKRD